MPDTPTLPPSPRVLLAGGDAAELEFHADALRRAGYEVVTAGDATKALQVIVHQSIDVVVAEARVAGSTDAALLQEIRRRDLEIPLIVLTPLGGAATPTLEQDVFRSIEAPAAEEQLRAAVRDAVVLATAQRVRREAESVAPPARPPSGRAPSERPLGDRFLAALAGIHMAYQPVVSAETHAPIGYEALMRNSERTLASPLAVLEAAERLGSIHLLGRTARRHVAMTLSTSPPIGSVYVNLHPADLADEDLYREDAPLTEHAARVVLEITERASLEAVGDVKGRVERLRRLGFRIAVDDLGAGYAGLSVFALLAPDVVKLDMSLVRGIGEDLVKQRVTKSMITLSRDLGMELIAEGVETVAERDALIRLGCVQLQGYLFARPGPPFPVALWP